MRTYDLEKIIQAVSQYKDGDFEGFYPEEWIQNTDNIALINDNEDIALFENQEGLPGIVCGHYFLFSRGREAIKASKRFLEEIFSDEYNVEVILGLTPKEHKAALWMNRQLGFESHGIVDTSIGPCEFVMLTRQQWKDNK